MKRLYSLDALRGIAALSIVFWHWQHFFAVSGDFPEVWDRTTQPFYGLFKPLYLQGWAAVDLFFALSGFVFFWLYREAIRDRRITAGKFALLRFSRLWPLHVLTLVIVLGLQSAFRHATGEFFIFPADSMGRFAANFFAVQQWLPPNIDQSFNGPAWTVSIEAGLYVLFFCLCRLGLNGPKTALMVPLAGILLFRWNWFIARGLIGFFLGGVAYFAVERVRLRAKARRLSWLLIGVSLLLWVVTILEVLYGPMHQGLAWLAALISPAASRLYGEFNGDFFHLAYIFAVIPVSIAALALSETVLNVLAPVYRRVSFLGDISYSTYMLHFPLQIACALAALKLGFDYPVFMHPAAMIGFYAVLIGLGSLSFFLFEKPVQRLIRGLVEKS